MNLVKAMLFASFTSVFFAGFAAEASLFPYSKVTCYVLDEAGTAVKGPYAMRANSKTVQPIRVTEDGVLYLRWKYHTRPLQVVMENNPHYPFRLPFGSTVLGKAQIAKNDAGLIDDVLDLSPIKAGYQLTCRETKH